MEIFRDPIFMVEIMRRADASVQRSHFAGRAIPRRDALREAALDLMRDIHELVQLERDVKAGGESEPPA